MWVVAAGMTGDELATVIVFIFFVGLSLALVGGRTGRTKLKSRYAYMALTFALSLAILLYLVRRGRLQQQMIVAGRALYDDDVRDVNDHVIEPTALEARAVQNSIGKLKKNESATTAKTVAMTTTTTTTSTTTTLKATRKASGSPTPAAVRRPIDPRRARRFRDKQRAVKRNLFVELDKFRHVIGPYLTRSGEEGGKLVPSIPSAEAQSRYRVHLPWWEVEEMSGYPEVWYIGVNSSKIAYNPDEPHMNFGFDEWEDSSQQEDDDERMLAISIGDHLEYRYEMMQVLGHGSYGRVVLARDHARPIAERHHRVAIKIMHNESRTERYFRQECDMLDYIRDHTKEPELYTKVLRRFFFRNHFCIVFELLGKSLFRTISGPQTDMDLLRRYLRDIIIPLRNLHEINIVHGDLKPENLMMIPGCNESCKPMLKMADFNLACTPMMQKFPCPGVYFQTRHYRAPEVILDLNYTVQADMWSVGVMTGELFLGELPFYGETSTDQLAAIMEVIGLIPARMVQDSPRIETYQAAVNYKCKNGFKRQPYRKPLTKVLAKAPPLLFDFVRSCLVLDPERRMSSRQALDHPFLRERGPREHQRTNRVT